MTDLSRRQALGAGAAILAAAATTTARAQSPEERRRRFTGQAVVITGATSGIGRAAAEAFAREGASVAFCGRREALGREVEARLLAMGAPDAIYVRADVREPDAIAAFVDAAAERFGGLDVALNNAGVNWFKPLHETTDAEWAEMAETNTRGVFLAMRAQVPHLLRRGGGSIIVTASMHEHATRPGGAAYAASKRGVIGLVQAAALDYGRNGIRVNALSPGIVNTRMFTDRNATEADRQAAAKSVDGLGRVAEAEEMAGPILFLASSDSSYLTGATLLADGGLLAGI